MTTCSILLYVHDEKIKTLRVTAVYFPPLKSLKMEMVSMLTDPSVAVEEEGEVVGHVLGGDFNDHSWSGEFEEWISEHGVWVLSDPAAPTFGSGNALDKFLFVF